MFTSSKQIKEKGLPAWRWTKKYVGGVEQGTVADGKVEEKDSYETNAVGQLRRKVSNAGLI